MESPEIFKFVAIVMSCTVPRLDPLRTSEFIIVPKQYLEVGGFEGWDGERAGWPGSGGASCGGTMRGGDGEASLAGRRAWGGAGGSRGPTLRSCSSGTRGFPTCWVGRRILKKMFWKCSTLQRWISHLDSPSLWNITIVRESLQNHNIEFKWAASNQNKTSGLRLLGYHSRSKNFGRARISGSNQLELRVEIQVGNPCCSIWRSEQPAAH